MKQKISFVIPIFNEQETILLCYQQIKATITTAFSSYEKEIIFINDGSTDTTLTILKQLAKRDPSVHVVSFRRNFGKALALNAGFKKATGNTIVTLDADLQDEPKNIPLLIEKLNQNYDLVIGWRKERRDPLSKTVPSRIFNFVVKTISRVNIHDFNTGLKAMRKEVADELYLYGELYRFIPILAVQRGFTVTEVPVSHQNRRFGKSKYGWKRLSNGFFDFFTILFLSSFNQRPLHFFGLVGTIEIGLGTIFGTYLSLLRFSGKTIGNRPLLTLTMLLIVTGMQLISIGLIAEMIVNRTRHNERLPIDFETK